SFIVGVLTTIVCLVLKLDYAIVFGVLIFVLNFVPYIGALISEIVIAIYALTVGGPVFAIVTLILLIAIQILDANVLQPNIIGKSVDLHPVIVFAGLIVGNLLMGIVGMIIVVPVLAIIRIMFKYKFSKDSLK
ncbi:MAG: AI-2E family transporter, partial [Clostridia bacterium]